MKISKRKILILSSLLTVSSSLVLAACNKTRAQEVLISLPWKTDDSRVANFKEWVDHYNNQIKENQEMKAQGYLPAKINAAGLGYGGIVTQLVTDINARNNLSIPQLTLNYPSMVSSLAIQRRTLNFGEETPSFQNKKVTYKDAEGKDKEVAYVSDKIDTSIFADQYLKINKNIQGIDDSKNGVYLVPVGVSTEILYLSKPVLNYLLSKVVEDGVGIHSGDEDFFKENFGVKKPAAVSNTPEAPSGNTAAANTQSSDERSANVVVRETYVEGAGSSETAKPAEKPAYKPDSEILKKVERIWGGYSRPTSGGFGSSDTLKKADFENYDSLMELSKKLAASFTKSLAANSGKKDATASTKDTKTGERARILSFDSPESYLYTYSFNALGSDYSKYLWSRPANSKPVDPFKFFVFKSGTEQYRTFKTAYDKIKDIASLGGYAYATNKDDDINSHFKNLEYAISMGSNSRWSRKVNTDDAKAKSSLQLSKKDVLTLKHPMVNSENATNGSYVLQGGSLVGVDVKDEKLNRATKLFAKWFFSASIQNKNPAVEYGLKSSYIPSTKGFLDDANNKDKLKTPPSKSAWDLFKEGLGNATKYKPYSDPASQEAHDFRNNLKSQISLYQSSHNGNLQDFDAFLTKLGESSPSLAAALTEARK